MDEPPATRDRLRRVGIVITSALAVALFTVALLGFSGSKDVSALVSNSGVFAENEAKLSPWQMAQASNQQASAIIQGAESGTHNSIPFHHDERQKALSAKFKASEESEASNIVGSSEAEIRQNVEFEKSHSSASEADLQVSEAAQAARMNAAQDAEARSILSFTGSQSTQKPMSHNSLALAAIYRAKDSAEASNIISFSEAQMAHDIKYKQQSVLHDSHLLAKKLGEADRAEAAAIISSSEAQMPRDIHYSHPAHDSHVLASTMHAHTAEEASSIIEPAAALTTHTEDSASTHKFRYGRALGSDIRKAQAAVAASIVSRSPVPPRAESEPSAKHEAAAASAGRAAAKAAEAADIVGLPLAQLHLSLPAAAVRPPVHTRAEAHGIVAAAITKEAAEVRLRGRSAAHVAAARGPEAAGGGDEPAAARPPQVQPAVGSPQWSGAGDATDKNVWASMSPLTDDDAPGPADVDYPAYAADAAAAASAQAGPPTAASSSLAYQRESPEQRAECFLLPSLCP